MNDLLSRPGVAESVAKMTDKELEFYKQMLVRTGVYQRFVLEEKKKQIKEIIIGK